MENPDKTEKEMQNTNVWLELKEKYCDDLWNDIKNHWLRLNAGEISFESPAYPWFGDIQYWWDDVKKNFHPSVFERFPGTP